MQHFIRLPGRIAASNGSVVLDKFTVVSQPGFMSQQLTQRERTFKDYVIESNNPITHQ
ncbi:hypothetical protein GmRootA79_45840 [Acidovorax sp. A79]|nr:hypothetical protein [Acidovorax sp. sif1233]